VRRAVVVLLAVLALSACQRLSREECETLCWRYSELQYWAEFERLAADLSPADRETLKAEKAAAWAELRKQHRSRDNCVSACRRGGTKAEAACVAKAETSAAAAACLKRDD
jgi:hypothetical protein